MWHPFTTGGSCWYGVLTLKKPFNSSFVQAGFIMALLCVMNSVEGHLPKAAVDIWGFAGFCWIDGDTAVVIE